MSDPHRGTGAVVRVVLHHETAGAARQHDRGPHRIGGDHPAEDLHQLGIEGRAALAQDELVGLVRGAADAVDAVGRDRVVDVGDGRDAGVDVDLLALLSRRVALAVPPLVVAGDDRAGERRDGHALDHRGPRLGVVADHLHLVVGQPARLAEHVVGHDDLADVVQQQPEAEHLEPALDVVHAPLAAEVDPAVLLQRHLTDEQADQAHVHRVVERVGIEAAEVAEEGEHLPRTADLLHDPLHHALELDHLPHRDLGRATVLGG